MNQPNVALVTSELFTALERGGISPEARDLDADLTEVCPDSLAWVEVLLALEMSLSMSIPDETLDSAVCLRDVVEAVADVLG